MPSFTASLLLVCALACALHASVASADGCHSDEQCYTQPTDWRCSATKGQGETCHIPGPGTQGNATCACGPAPCSDASYTKPQHPDFRQYLMIGDSISIGMHSIVFNTLSSSKIEGVHNPGNAANSNWGAHNLDCWTLPTKRSFDLISFNFGLHDLAYDTELLSLDAYSALMTNITTRLTQLQSRHGGKLLWVNTTPVPTVPVYGPNCTNTSTCLNPPRYNSDVVAFNRAASKVIATANSNGANISTLDLYDFVIKKCGGAGYAHCDGFQLPYNVHYTPAGWTALAQVMSQRVLQLMA